ncbi:MAG: CoA transferase [Chloroflexi bacterium]|nr:CoA transferase [Chloroflexota bacterium]MDA1002531.1 CoA transferase [Chloroflexota bacterium]
MTSRILAGVRVVELAEVWAGPMGGSYLGDLGANVIKVESFPRTSVTRIVAPTPPGQGPSYETSATQQTANRNKRHMALNLRTDRGPEVLRRLIAQADILTESYSAGTFAKMGFGWEFCRQVNPRLSLISMPGWGVTGPYQGYVTLGSGLDASGGHWSLRGYPDDPDDLVPAVFHSDATGALTLVFAAVTALRRREQTGAGTHIDLSQIEALAWQLPGAFAEWTMNGRVPRRTGNMDPVVVPHGVYLTSGGEATAGADGAAWVAIAAENDAQWAGVAGVLGHTEWAADGHPWATVTGRLAARAAIDAVLSEYALTATAETIADAVQAAGGIAAPVIAPWSVLTSAQHLARNWLESVDHRWLGTQLFPGFPWRTSPDAASWDRPSGLVGEHNSELLGELGYAEVEIASMLADGVIGDHYGPRADAD